MLVRLAGAALALALLMSGCGHRNSTYGSTSDIAAAIGCTDGGGPRVHPDNGYTREKCTYQGHSLAIYTFQKKNWSYHVGVEGVASHVHGTGWDVWCSRPADCVEVQRTIDGDLVRNPAPNNG